MRQQEADWPGTLASPRYHGAAVKSDKKLASGLPTAEHFVRVGLLLTMVVALASAVAILATIAAGPL